MASSRASPLPQGAELFGGMRTIVGAGLPAKAIAATPNSPEWKPDVTPCKEILTKSTD